jgi:methylase of polypeptide subunit release factors
MADNAPAHDERTRAALQALVSGLKARGYHFATPTPETHARVIGRPDQAEARDCRDVFGWNLAFAPDVLDPNLLALMRQAGVIEATPEGLRSTIRAASLEGEIYLHSAFPPSDADSVFFGPDTYRFAAFLGAQLDQAPAVRVLVDIGAGSGAGAVVAARRTAPSRIVLTDVNPRALALAEINLAVAGLSAEYRCGRGLAGLEEPIDLIIANPPFIRDQEERTYRDGGDLHGARVSLDWATQGASALVRGGRMLLYTGVAIIKGEDLLLKALRETLDNDRFKLAYRELDPDIHGDTLDLSAYREVERIAAVGAVISRRV